MVQKGGTAVADEELAAGESGSWERAMEMTPRTWVVVELGFDFVTRIAGAPLGFFGWVLLKGSPPWIMKPLMTR